MKKIKISIFIVIILMSIYLIINTLSKYNNEANTKIEQNVGRWNIKINDVDITVVSGEPVEFDVANFTWDESTHVAEGKVAPGMKGQFEITIDPKDTDVSVQYSIKIDNSKLTESNDINLKIQKIILNGEEYEFSSTPIITGEEGNEEETGTEIEVAIVKPLEEVQSTDDNVRIDNLIVEVEWENNEANNQKDSEIGKVPNNVITLPIIVDVIQYTGETSASGG